jgi:hypothetical protein
MRGGAGDSGASGGSGIAYIRWAVNA